MHHCLRIDEILHNIFAHLTTDRSRLDAGLCCRSFLDPAMDVLWGHLLSFRPLFLCLPKDFITGTLSIDGLAVEDTIQPPSPEDWLRFKSYARRVKRLAIQSFFGCATQIQTPPKFIGFVRQHYPGPGPILPNLQHFELYDANVLRYVDVFIHSSIRCARIEPNLNVARFSLISFGGQREGTLSLLDELDRAICRAPNLVSFDLTCLSLSPRIITHLSSLHRLRTLSLLITDGSCIPSRTSVTMFPTLECLLLAVESDNTSVCATFLESISAPKLLDLGLDLFLEAPTSDMRQLFRSLGAFHQLQALKLKFERCCLSVWAGIIVDGDAMFPLFALKSMRNFSLSCLPLRLDTAHWEKLAQGWPILEELSIVALPPIPRFAGYRTLISFQDFAVFAKHSHHLRTLVIEPDVSGIWHAPGPNDVHSLPSAPSVVKVDLQDSEITGETSGPTRGFLHHIFPNATFRHWYGEF